MAKLTADEATRLVMDPASNVRHADVVAQLPDGVVWNASAERFEEPKAANHPEAAARTASPRPRRKS